MIEVIQADRDAAADYLFDCGHDWGYCGEIRAGREHPVVPAFAKHRTTSLAALDHQVLALVEAARDAGDVLQSAANPSNLDPQYSGQIAALGERIGYGALMHGASALWRKSLGDLAGSEFSAGPCVSTAASRLARLDYALMPFRGETLPDAPSLAAQDGLVEALRAQHDAEMARNECEECEGEGDWGVCSVCSLAFGNAIDLRHAALSALGNKP